jgi:LysM repeat protein
MPRLRPSGLASRNNTKPEEPEQGPLERFFSLFRSSGGETKQPSNKSSSSRAMKFYDASNNRDTKPSGNISSSPMRIGKAREELDLFEELDVVAPGVITVVSGDTLSAIARDNNTTVAEIQKANPNITNPDRINVGQDINIPSAAKQKAKPIKQNLVGQQDTASIKGSEVGLMSRPILQKTPTDDSLEQALAIASSIKNAKPEDIYNKVIMPLAYHESDGTMDAKLAQYGGGPGRGVMQYEPDRFNSSVVRAIRQFNDLGKDIPEWLDNIDLSGDIQKEITSLTANQQMSLAVYDLLQKSGVDIGEVLSGKESIEDVWADHWWQGPKKQRKKRIASFRRSQRQLNKNAPSNNTTTFEFP